MQKKYFKKAVYGIALLGISLGSAFFVHKIFAYSGPTADPPLGNKSVIHENPIFIDYANKKIGIGTDLPNRQLHVYDTANNAEIDIQSVSGAGNHWAIYNNNTDNELRFWHDNINRFRLAPDGAITVSGRVGNVTAPDNDSEAANKQYVDDVITGLRNACGCP